MVGVNVVDMVEVDDGVTPMEEVDVVETDGDDDSDGVGGMLGVQEGVGYGKAPAHVVVVSA